MPNLTRDAEYARTDELLAQARREPPRYAAPLLLMAVDRTLRHVFPKGEPREVMQALTVETGDADYAAGYETVMHYVADSNCADRFAVYDADDCAAVLTIAETLVARIRAVA